MLNELEKIKTEIMEDEDNILYTSNGIEPLFSAPATAKILIIGQAPGEKAQKNRVFFKDKSGDTLRKWMGISEDIFYNSELVAVVPMDFYYPGKGKNGDLPPRKNFAPKWHERVMHLMPNLEVIILVGSYAQNYYLKDAKKKNLTETVRSYEEYLPRYFPIVHPSPLNFRWHNKNPWFLEEVVEKLRERVQEVLKTDKK